jgi:hypothetical protein
MTLSQTLPGPADTGRSPLSIRNPKDPESKRRSRPLRDGFFFWVSLSQGTQERQGYPPESEGSGGVNQSYFGADISYVIVARLILMT